MTLFGQTSNASVMTSTNAGPSWAMASAIADGNCSISVTRMPLAPQSSAKAANSRLCREVCRLFAN